MRFSTASLLSTLSLLASSPLASAMRVIESNSLNTCMTNSQFTADLFNVALTPDNSSASLNINGVSSIQGYIVANVEVIAYGFVIVNETLDPCKLDLDGFCPMSKGQLLLETNFALSNEVLAKVPSIAYSVPDLDGVVRVKVYSVTSSGGLGSQIACLEADLSNTKSVYQKAVGWVTAIIAGIGLIASGITSGLGNTNTAAHVAANAVSLFGLFQAQAIIGMTSVTMPPIVQAWTQNFQWSMGVIRVGFLQRLATWYQRATGGTPTTYLSTLSTYSVQVQRRAIKRSVEMVTRFVAGAAPRVFKRATSTSTTLKSVTVRGIDRVGFLAGIEQTNIFMTGLIFFIGILVVVAILVALSKAILDGCAKAGWTKSDKFRDFRNGWKIVIKGILFRLVFLGWAQMAILCLWQIVERDSAAEVVLALFVFLSMAGALLWASYKVITLARRSVQMHKNPAYVLYSDPTCLNKWGFLYVSYKATSYYFVCVVLIYILVKSIFVAFAQSSPVAQAVGLVVVEAAFLITASVLRPWMDKKVNIFNISIAAVNFINAIFLLIFSDAFGQPAMVSGVMGVIFAFYNVVFIAVLLILVLIASIYAIASKNPETRYQPMRDDRGSFIKSQSALTTELDALGATARGDGKNPYGESKDLDEDSLSSDSLNKTPTESATHRPLSGSRRPPDYARVPAYASQQSLQQPYNDSSFGQNRPSTAPSSQNGPGEASLRAPASQYPPKSAHGGYPPQQSFRQQNNSSPWQRGAGYE